MSLSRRPAALVMLSLLAASCGPFPAARFATSAKAARATTPPGPARANPQAGSAVSKSTAEPAAANAGSLVGSVLGPRAGIISNNGASIVSNNGGGLISNNGGSYRVRQAADRLAAVAGARVEVVDAEGRAVSEPTTTGADGRFTIPRLKPSGPLVIVRVSYDSEGRHLTMAAALGAPRGPGEVPAAVTPASTLVAAKVLARVKAAPEVEQAFADAPLSEAAKRLGEALSDRAMAEAVLSPATQLAAAYDRLLGDRPELASALEAIAGPALAPGDAPLPASVAPSATPTASATAAPSSAPSATPTPWPASAYTVARVAGSGTGGRAIGANRLGDTFMQIAGLVVTQADAYLVADPVSHQVRRLPTSGATQLIAGLADGTSGYSANTLATSTPLNQPHGLAYDSAAGDVYLCDTGNQRIRRLAGGVLTTLVGGGADAADSVAVATSAQLAGPTGLARDGAGNLFFTESGTSRVRRYDAATGALSTLATGTGDGPIALDAAHGLVWVAKGGTVRAIGNVNGVPTVASTPTFQAMAGVGAPQVTGLTYDGAGTLYVAQASFPASGVPVDVRIHRVAVDASGLSTGAPVTIAGTGGQSGTPAGYSVPTTGTGGLTLPLASQNRCALTVAPNGTLYAGNSYPGQWGQVLKLTP